MKTLALRNHFRASWSLWVLMGIAAVWLSRTPYSVSDLNEFPDSVEYAVGALQLLETGRYEIIVQDRPLPPRYPPWFSAVVLLPAYFLFGDDLGNGIFPVTLLAIGGIGLAWAIGRRISGTAGGILAALAVLAMPTYNTWAGEIMTDVPCTTLMLASCLLFLRLRGKPRSVALYFLAGLLVAFATLLRPVFAAMLLPFLLALFRTRADFVRRGAALLLPMIAAAAASLAYNAATFGSPTRNGYHFWTSVPSDYPALAFSLLHAPPTLFGLLQTALPWYFAIALAVWFAAKATNHLPEAAARGTLFDVLTFFFLTAAPIFLFHLLYFFPSDRFQLPLLVSAAVLTGAAAGFLIPERRARIFAMILPAVLLLAVAIRLATPEPAPKRRIAADRMRTSTPEHAIIMTGIEPVYADRLVGRNSQRRIIPFTRHVEYASKVLVRKRIAHPQPPPARWQDARAEGLLKGGAEEAVLFVAEEQLPALVAEAARGTPIFFEASTLQGRRATEVAAQFEERFAFIERAPKLYELRLR